MCEKSVGYNTCDLIETLFHIGWMIYDQVEDIYDVIAVISDTALAINRISAQFYNLPSNKASRHGDNLYWQREFAQYRDELTFVCYADKFL